MEMNDDKTTEHMSGSGLCRHHTLKTYQIRAGANPRNHCIDLVHNQKRNAARSESFLSL